MSMITRFLNKKLFVLLIILSITFGFSAFINKNDTSFSELSFTNISSELLSSKDMVLRDVCLRKLRLEDSIDRPNAKNREVVDELELSYDGQISGDFSNLPQYQFSSSIARCFFAIGTPAVAVGDVNADGYPDIVKAPNLLYLNKYGERFELIKLPLPNSFQEDDGFLTSIPNIESWPGTPVIADLNLDGKVEIIFTNRISVGGQKIVVIASNDGANWRVDNSYSFNFGNSNNFPNSTTVTVFDFNNDRYPDILLGFTGGQNFLYNKERGKISPGLMLLLNKGNGSFEDISASFNLNEKLKYVLSDNLYVGSRTKFVDPIMFVNAVNTNDYNNDGYIDIYVAGDYGTGVMLYNNRGQDLIVDTRNSFLGHSLMGPASIDINSDGILDIFASQIHQKISTTFVCPGNIVSCDSDLGNNFWVSKGAGVWEEKGDVYGLREGGWGWGSVFADLDNDGRSELLQMSGQVLETSPAEVGWNHRRDKIRLFKEGGSGKFTDVAGESGLLLPFSSASVGVLDFNLDGLLDVVVASGFSSEPFVFINKSESKGNYISVDVRDKVSNAPIINSKVEIRGGGKSWFGYTGTEGQSHFSNSDNKVRFGVGKLSMVDITVKSLDGVEINLKNQVVNTTVVVLV
jgi:hypothetical protein